MYAYARMLAILIVTPCNYVDYITISYAYELISLLPAQCTCLDLSLHDQLAHSLFGVRAIDEIIQLTPLSNFCELGNHKLTLNVHTGTMVHATSTLLSVTAQAILAEHGVVNVLNDIF